MNFFNNPNRIPENYGLRIAAGLIAYFLLMQLLNLSHIVELRMVNVVILAAGIFFGLKKYKESHGKHINYFRAFAIGVATGAIGSLVFAFVMFLYMKLNASFMASIMANEPKGFDLNPYIAAFIVGLEGFFSGLFVTFVLINYITTDEVNE